MIGRTLSKSVLCVFSALAWAQLACSSPTPGYDPGASRPIDLVICLDTSNSMDGLINSARSRLWSIVSELAKAKPTPFLRVGLLTYGSPHVSTAAQGWVVKQTDLTADLDTVYAKMTALSTNGGEEYVGWVLNNALYGMNWSGDSRALKMIFVAGNESADQAVERVNFRLVANGARARGIIISSIYCGTREQGVAEAWEQVAQYGGGSFSAINMAAGTVQISAPQDSILIKLNAELNATYIPYGSAGVSQREVQVRQDENARMVGEQSFGDRVVAKATTIYRNEHWDLVDAAAKAEFKFEEVAASDLPPNMQTMNVGERRAYVDDMRARRAQVQAKIKEVAMERDRYLDRAAASVPAGSGPALDDALTAALRKEAEAKGFTFEEKK